MSNTAILATESPLLSATSLIGDKVRNSGDEYLGTVEELMIDFRRGRIAYAVVSFGGIFGLGDKLFAIPFSLLELNPSRKCFVLDVTKQLMQEAPGFDKKEWPNMADLRWGGSIHDYYGQTPYWAVEHGPRERRQV